MLVVEDRVARVVDDDPFLTEDVAEISHLSVGQFRAEVVGVSHVHAVSRRHGSDSQVAMHDDLVRLHSANPFGGDARVEHLVDDGERDDHEHPRMQLEETHDRREIEMVPVLVGCREDVDAAEQLQCRRGHEPLTAICEKRIDEHIRRWKAQQETALSKPGQFDCSGHRADCAYQQRAAVDIRGS